MELVDLQKIAARRRALRQALSASGLIAVVFGLFLFMPFTLASRTVAPPPVTIATTTTDSAFLKVPLTARAAVVYDLTTGRELYAQNADAQLPLASLTKLLTVYAAFSQLAPTTAITIPDSVTNLTPPHAFSAGQTFALSDLARITLTASLNDGAAAIALATAQQKQTTTSDMLASAATGLGLSQTYAVNGSGLDMSTTISGGYGSAHDMAILAGALVKKAPLVAAATTESFASASSEGGTHFTVHNTDPIVENVPHLLLSKTGFTDLAGGNLALVFDVGLQHPIAVVVLGSTEKARFTDGMALVAATYAHFAKEPSL